MTEKPRDICELVRAFNNNITFTILHNIIQNEDDDHILDLENRCGYIINAEMQIISKLYATKFVSIVYIIDKLFIIIIIKFTPNDFESVFTECS